MANKMTETSDSVGNWRMTTQIAMVLNVTKTQLNGDKGWMELQKDGITVTKLLGHLLQNQQGMCLDPLG